MSALELIVWDRDLPGAEFRIRRHLKRLTPTAFGKTLHRRRGRFLMGLVQVQSNGLESRWWHIPHAEGLVTGLTNLMRDSDKRECVLTVRFSVSAEVRAMIEAAVATSTNAQIVD